MPTLTQAQAWYPDDDPVHGFDHILRVYRLAERLALAEGADVEIVLAAALLHDAQEGRTQGGESGRADHQNVSADFASEVLGAEGWDASRIAAVQHCIRAHRFRHAQEAPQTLEAQVLFDADKLDAIGATGAARAVGHAALNHQPFFREPSTRFWQTGELEPGEPHTAYHEFLFKLGKLPDRLYTKTARSLAAERHTFLEAFFKRLGQENRGEA
jgi:uncharacterized protein